MKIIGCLTACALLSLTASAYAQDEGGDPKPAEGAKAEGGGEAKAEAKPEAKPAEEKVEGGGHTEFGQSGVIALEATTGLDASTTSHKVPGGGSADSTTHIRFEPSFHYFVAENISVGALIGFDYTKQGDVKDQAIGFGPIVGYNLPLAEKLSLWPQVGGTYTLVSRSEVVPPSTTAESKSGNKMQLLVNVPVLVHLATHFHFGIGPYLRMDLASKFDGADAPKDTAIGLLASIGGWL